MRVPAGVLIEHDIAGDVRRALVAYMKREWVSDPRLSRLVEELDVTAADSRFGSDQGAWVDTATAASALRISVRRVRTRCREGTLTARLTPSGRWLVWLAHSLVVSVRSNGPNGQCTTP
jgi:hypothetical protein